MSAKKEASIILFLGVAIMLCSGSAAAKKTGEMGVKLRPHYFAGVLQLEADARETEVADRAGNRLSVKILDPGTGKSLTRGVIRRSGAGVYDQGELSIEHLPPGEYRVEARLQAQTGKWLTDTVTLKLRVPGRPEWYNSKAGISDEVLPPWTPLGLEGKTVSCWGREYRFNDLPFPAQILSAGEEILKDPVAIRVTVNGSVMAWRDGRVTMIEHKPNIVTLDAAADSAMLSLKGRTRIEYDGMLKVDCTFIPKTPLSLDGLTVAIPLKQEQALYINAPYMERQRRRFINRINYDGCIDRDGWEWKHRFTPAISIRGNERGLDWACESDEGWKPYDRPDTLRVHRRGDRVVLEIRICGKTKLEKPLNVSMILQAVPVRPFPKDYRKFHIIHFLGGPQNEGQTWDIEGIGRTSYPIRGVREAAARGAGTIIFHELWSRGYGGAAPYKPEEFRKVVELIHSLGMKVVVYYGASPDYYGVELWPESPECKTYGEEWKGIPSGAAAKVAADGRSDQRFTGYCNRAPQLLNYLAHGLKALVAEYDIDGVYIDGGDAYPCHDTMHGCGYADEETGKVRPTFNVLPQRELRKRFYTILCRYRDAAFIDQHLPFGQSAPIHAFTTSYLAGEPLANVATYHAPASSADYKFPLPWMRQEFTGLQFGAPAEILIYRNELIQKYSANSLIHGTYLRIVNSDYLYVEGASLADWMMSIWKVADDFGIEDATWLPYWKNADVVRVSPDAVKVSLYQRPDKGVLLFVGNTGQEDADAKIELDLTSLGLPAVGLKAADPISKKAISLERNVLSFKIKAETFRAVWIRSAKK